MADSKHRIHRQNQRLGREIILQAIIDYQKTYKQNTPTKQNLFYDAERFLFPQNKIQEAQTKAVLELADIQINDFRYKAKTLAQECGQVPPKGTRLQWC